MTVEPFTVESGGLTLAGALHVPEVPPLGWVVASHGLLSAKDSPKMRAVAYHLCCHGLAVARYDHRGCGASQGEVGRTTVASRLADLDAVLRHCRDRVGPGAPVGLLGSSLGGFISLLRGARDPSIRALVLWSTPLFITHPERDAPAGAAALLPDARDHDLRDVAAGVARCLVVHGEADRVVPAAHATSLHGLLGPPKGLRLLPGADHSLSRPDDRRRALQWSRQWFLEHLAPPGPRVPGDRPGTSGCATCPGALVHNPVATRDTRGRGVPS